MKPRLSLIAAIARNGVIGRDNDLPWHLPADLQFFKRTTCGHAIILGRRNYESIGRPLPNRTNIVITRDKNYKAQGCVVAHSIDEAIALAGDDEEIFIIGGSQVYAQALDCVTRMYITEVDTDADGDVLFPEFDKSQWQEVSREPHTADDQNDYAFDFVMLERKHLAEKDI